MSKRQNYHPASESSPAYTMRKRPITIMKSVSPGPGDYRPMHKRSSSSSGFTFGKSSRDRLGLLKTPGPSDYPQLVRQSTSASIGAEKRRSYFDPKPARSPGPGAYTQVNQTINGPIYSIKSRKSIENKYNPTPGPGDFRPTTRSIQED